MSQTIVDSAEASALTAREDVPGPSGFAGLKLWRAFEKDALGSIERIMHEYGDVARMNLGLVDIYLVTHPDGVRRVLQENNTNYNKDTFDYRALRVIDGNGLLTSDGPHWLRQRRIMQPAFHRQRIAELASGMSTRIAVMCEEWERLAQTGEQFDLQDELQRLTLDIVTGALFGADVSSRAGEVAGAFTDVNEAAVKVLFNPISALVPELAFRMNRKGGRALKAIHRIVGDIISERRRTGENRGDLLSMLLDARDEDTGEGMSDEQLRSEVLILMLAGHETTMNALGWTFYLLAKHPAHCERLREEATSVLAGRAPTVDDVAELPYTRMVLDESMRIFPPAWALSRAALDDDVVCGYRIPKGAVVFLTQWGTHRHPEFWHDPETFDPERFSPEKADGRHKYAYFPFGGGPRLCIGNSFSIMESVMTLASVLSRYRVQLDPDDLVVEPEPLVTLRPKHGVPVRISKI